MNNHLLTLLKENGVSIQELVDVNPWSVNYVNELYQNEQQPIFEHSIYHILTYLKFESRLYALEGKFGKTILVIREGNQFIFTPKVDDTSHFETVVSVISEYFKLEQIIIQNVSESWIDSMSDNLSLRMQSEMQIIPRSKEEVVYDTDLYIDMIGRNFTSLRNTNRKLLLSGMLSFESVQAHNIQDCLLVLQKWQQVQGFKYNKNKHRKEIFLLSSFVRLSGDNKDIVYVVGKIKGEPYSIAIMYRNTLKKNWGTSYLLKGINRPSDGGIHGVSDATYLFLFDEARKMGIKFLNDGELGYEEGTRQHKLSFNPIMFLKSYDVIIKNFTIDTNI